MKYPRWNNRRIFYSEEDVLDYINTYNGKSQCIISLYGFTDILDNKPLIESVIVDKVLLDGNYESLKLVYEKTKSLYNSILMYDGKRFSLILLLNEELSSNEIESECNKLVKCLNLDASSVNVNTKLDRMICIPKTWNPKAKCYVVAYYNMFPSLDKILMDSRGEKLE